MFIFKWRSDADFELHMPTLPNGNSFCKLAEEQQFIYL